MSEISETYAMNKLNVLKLNELSWNEMTWNEMGQRKHNSLKRMDVKKLIHWHELMNLSKQVNALF